MKAGKLQPVKVTYPKMWFIVGTVVSLVLTVLFFYFAWETLEDSTRMFWSLCGIVMSAVALLFFLPPTLTTHFMGERALRVRMGLLVNETIPYEWIREVRQTSVHWGAVRVGVGVRYSPIPKVLFVTSGFVNLVSLSLEEDHRMGRLLKRPVSEVVLSLENSTAFIDALNSRVGK